MRWPLGFAFLAFRPSVRLVAQHQSTSQAKPGQTRPVRTTTTTGTTTQPLNESLPRLLPVGIERYHNSQSPFCNSNKEEDDDDDHSP